MKLLIVDDDMWLCSSLARGLVKMGHFARTATSIDMALGLVGQEAPSAVLTDLDLGPGGNGVDLISRLRADGVRVPAILMTGSDATIARARLASAGHAGITVLEKPFAFEDLIKKLEELFPAEVVASAGADAPRATPVAAMASMMDSVVRSLGGRVQ